MTTAHDDGPGSAWLPTTVFIAAELALLAAAHLLGGPPWVAIGVLAVVGQVMADFDPRRLMGFVPALGWLAAFRITDNRELFFPFAMALAVHIAGEFFLARPRAGRRAHRGDEAARSPAGPWPAVAAGSLIVAAFLGIRLLQSATVRVLAVEAAVAAAILAAAVALLPWAARRPAAVWAITAAASLAAYAGLAL
jgi:hypothetical protein